MNPALLLLKVDIERLLKLISNSSIYIAWGTREVAEIIITTNPIGAVEHIVYIYLELYFFYFVVKYSVY